MELIEQYLEEVQKVGYVYVLRVDEKCTHEMMAQIYDHWTKNNRGYLVILPFQFDISLHKTYSFYIAMMLVRGRMKVTRKHWIQEAGGDKTKAPYLFMEEIEGVEMLVRKFPDEPDNDEFFFIGLDDLDADDYVVVGGN